MTIEDQERAAYAAGNTALAAALARVIDLENQACELRAVIRDAVDLIDSEKTDQNVSWHARATAALAWKGNKTLPIWLIPGEPECRLTRATGEALVFVPVVGPFPAYRKVVPAAPDGIHSHYDPDLLVRFKRAAEDLGSEKGVYSLLPGGDGSGLVYITGDVVGVIMPTRSGGLAVADCAWARE